MITDVILDATRPTTISSSNSAGDRPWNDPVARSTDEEDKRPTLKGIIFDFTAVSNIDVTSTQVLVDVRDQLERHAAPDPVYIHFAGIRSGWTRRALSSAGFGHSSAESRPVFSVAPASAGVVSDGEEKTGVIRLGDLERKLLPIQSIDRRECLFTS